MHSDTQLTAAYATAARIVPLTGWSGSTLLTLGGCTGVHFANLTFDDLGGYGSAGGTPLTRLVVITDSPAYCAALTFDRCAFIADVGEWGNSPWHTGQRGVVVTGTTGGSNNMFRHCAFTGLEIGYLNQNDQAYWNRFEHNRFWNNEACYQFEKCLKSQLIQDLTMGDNWYIRQGRGATGNTSGLLVDGLAMDSRKSVRTKWLWQSEQGEYGSGATTGQGGDCGALVFRNCGASLSYGYLQGIAPSVANNGSGYCRLTLDVPNLTSTSGSNWTKFVVGEKIRCLGFANGAYNTLHTITAVQQQGWNAFTGWPAGEQAATSQPVIVDTDIAFTTLPGSGTKWLEGGATFRLRGGGHLLVQDCYLGSDFTDASVPSISAQDYGRLIDMQPGDRVYGYPSRAIFERCQGVYAGFSPTINSLEYRDNNPPGVWINGTRANRASASRTDVSKYKNYIKFIDCYTKTIPGDRTCAPAWSADSEDLGIWS